MSSSSGHSSTWLAVSRWISYACRSCWAQRGQEREVGRGAWGLGSRVSGHSGSSPAAGPAVQPPLSPAAAPAAVASAAAASGRQHPPSYLVEVAALVAQRGLGDEVDLTLLHLRLPAVALQAGGAGAWEGGRGKAAASAAAADRTLHRLLHLCPAARPPAACHLAPRPPPGRSRPPPESRRPARPAGRTKRSGPRRARCCTCRQQGWWWAVAMGGSRKRLQAWSAASGRTGCRHHAQHPAPVPCTPLSTTPPPTRTAGCRSCW